MQYIERRALLQMTRVLEIDPKVVVVDDQALGRGAAVVLRKAVVFDHHHTFQFMHGHSRECLFDISIHFYK